MSEVPLLARMTRLAGSQLPARISERAGFPRQASQILSSFARKIT
jgi:hypothetical protein